MLDQATTPTPPPPPKADGGTVSRRQMLRVCASGWFGSALEFYDFFVYTQAAALVFPRIFFPQSDPAMALVTSLATFGVAYVVRPIGAIVMGHFGDRHGRKRVLVLSMLLMGCSTMLVGLLPTYREIGMWAAVLLVLLRCVQGFAVAAEITGSASLILEHSDPRRRGFFASFTLHGTQAGQLFAAAIFLPLTAFLSTTDLLSWGWRIPFLTSAVVIVAGLIIRTRVPETPVFESLRHHRARLPLVVAIRRHPGALGRVFLIALTNIIPTTIAVFGAAFATAPGYRIGMPPAVYLWIPIAANIVALVTIPIAGALSDRIGRRPLVAIGSVVPGFMTFGYLYFVATNNPVGAVVAAVLIWGVVYQCFNAVFPSFFAEQFPPRIRVSGMAVSQNLGTALSALMAVVFTVLVPAQPSTSTLSVILVVGGLTLLLSLLAGAAVLASPETRHGAPAARAARLEPVRS